MGPDHPIERRADPASLQIYLDWKEIGIKIVLEDEWMKMKEAPHE